MGGRAFARRLPLDARRRRRRPDRHPTPAARKGPDGRARERARAGPPTTARHPTGARARRAPDARSRGHPAPDWGPCARGAPDSGSRPGRPTDRPARIAADARRVPPRPSLGLRHRFAGLRGSNNVQGWFVLCRTRRVIPRRRGPTTRDRSRLGQGVETHENFLLEKNAYARTGNLCLVFLKRRSF